MAPPKEEKQLSEKKQNQPNKGLRSNEENDSVKRKTDSTDGDIVSACSNKDYNKNGGYSVDGNGHKGTLESRGQSNNSGRAFRNSRHGQKVENDRIEGCQNSIASSTALSSSALPPGHINNNHIPLTNQGPIINAPQSREFIESGNLPKSHGCVRTESGRVTQSNLQADAPRVATPAPTKSAPTPNIPNRGLRHFSMKVCEKVEEKGTTSYNEVADELVRELKEAEAECAACNAGDNSNKAKPRKSYDEKNIRRRVYDALNVLMAMDIITKDKKQITWRGLPGSRRDEEHESHEKYAQSDGEQWMGKGEVGGGEQGSESGGRSKRKFLEQLQDERAKREDEIRKKRECLQELMVQNVCFRNLLGRNCAREITPNARSASTGKERSKTDAVAGDVDKHRALITDQGDEGANKNGSYSKNNFGHKSSRDERYGHEEDEDGNVKEMEDEKIPLPFIVVNTNSKAVIQCEMCPKQTNVGFDFSMPFEINDDNEILKRIGMNRTSLQELQRTLPMDLVSYCKENDLLASIVDIGQPGNDNT